MATTIFGLRYKYASEAGKSLVFYERDGNELTENDLHDVQLKMINSNEIPHTLPLSVENLDLTTRLHYDITSMRKVGTFFRNQDSTMSEYYQLFLSIIQTLEDCASYMLTQQNYVLNKEFIFVGETMDDVYLTYLPITELKRNTTVTEDIQKLLTDVAGDIQGLQGNEFKSILNYISDDSFSLSGLKSLILELMSVRSNVHQPELMDYNPTPLTNQEGNIPSQSSIETGQNKQQNTQHEQSNTKEMIVEPEQRLTTKLPPLTSQEIAFLLGGATVALALTWLLYFLFTYAYILVLSIALSLNIVIGVIVYWKIWRPAVKIKPTQSIDTVEHKTEKHQQNTQNYQQQKPRQQSSFNAQNLQQRQQAPQPLEQSPKQKPEPVVMQSNRDMEQRAAATSFDNPIIGNNHDDTILLDDDDHLHDSSQEQFTPMLMKQNETGQEETIRISSNHFLIGRNPHSVNYVEKSIGVSRIHVEIVKIDGTTFAIKDLGSKNGTKVNGNALIPYKVYALNENDEIKIGRATYTYSWSNV